jgi:hypothetical protein
MYKVYRDEPKCNLYLDIQERQDTYSRHTNRLIDISAHRGVIDPSHPPIVPRLEVYEVCRARNRVFQLRVNAENTHTVAEIRTLRDRTQISVRKSAPPSRPTMYTWTTQLRECERQMNSPSTRSNDPRFLSPERRSRPSTTSSHRSIHDSGMTIIDDPTEALPPMTVPFRDKASSASDRRHPPQRPLRPLVRTMKRLRGMLRKLERRSPGRTTRDRSRAEGI